MMRRTALLIVLTLISCLGIGQYSISRLEPPFWWAGMKNTSLQLLVYGPRISELKPEISSDKVKIRETVTVQNANYLFIILDINPEAKPGSFDILFQKNNNTYCQFNYKLLEREEGSADRIGFNTSDVIYLITPDRFANGETDNDIVPGYIDAVNRADKEARHGGDLKGIENHLDYIAGMGFTAVWLNPVLENNMPKTSYHGYAITDFYKVDPRFGTNEDYKDLCEKMKKSGLKPIMDMVENHCGSEHWWMKDMPSSDWFNFAGQFVSTNHRRSTVQDPHVSQDDKALFPDGWFVSAMPDMNQKNPLVAQYLIQNSIWWVEYAGLSGIRQDTYSYPDKDFMSRWSCAIMDEYPNFSIVGEEWSENPAIVAYWQKGKVNPDGYTSCLGSLMDFPLQSALIPGLTEGDVYYKDGLIKMYEMLANDFLYADPDRMVVFPDNHDMNRFFTQIGGDINLFRMGIAYILTIRGIPQIYYGTEILMKSPALRDDGLIRADFPGGWKGDKVNAFSGNGLTPQQADAQKYLKTLLAWRKTKFCLHDGKLVHFTPEQGTYVYFRFNETEKVMVAFNKNYNDVTIDGGRFSEVIGSAVLGHDVISDKPQALDYILLPARSVRIIEF
jgi:neopullulanase